MISRHLVSTGEVTRTDVDEVWQTLAQRYGSTQQIASELISMIEKFPLIKGPNQGEQLQNLLDICKIILYNQRKCPELYIMDLSCGIESLRARLPEHI